MVMGQGQGNNNIDRKLNQLAREAKQHPPRSYERRVALNKLVEGILLSGKLSHACQHRCPYPPDIRNDLYDEALNQTFLEICQKIENYDPDRDVMAWCNYILKQRFLDAVERYKRRGMTYLPRTEQISWDCIENRLDFIKEEAVSEAQEIIAVIRENPNGMFTEHCLQGNPKAHFQFLALARIWADRKLQDISVELNIPQSSLCEFYKKKLKEFTPFFIDYLGW
jgi:DNA-directed RNA polymerase specialized sigma24 family protein